MWLPQWGRSPGADDDGSGTVTILEVFRALVNTGFRPHRPVEFHWYSAEEAGLLGSQDVAKSYERKAVDVLAMIQVGILLFCHSGFFSIPSFFLSPANGDEKIEYGMKRM